MRCSHFQRFSNCLKHIFKFVAGVKMLTCNYLDDFLFLQDSQEKFNRLVGVFLSLCKKLESQLPSTKLNGLTSDGFPWTPTGWQAVANYCSRG